MKSLHFCHPISSGQIEQCECWHDKSEFFVRQHTEYAHKYDSRSDQLYHSLIDILPLSLLVEQPHSYEGNSTCHTFRESYKKIPVPRGGAPVTRLVFHAIEIKAIQLWPHNEQLLWVSTISDIVLYAPKVCVNRNGDKQGCKG